MLTNQQPEQAATRLATPFCQSKRHFASATSLRLLVEILECVMGFYGL